MTVTTPKRLAQVRSSLVSDPLLAEAGCERNLLADCCTLGLYCVTLNTQYIFKCSLQVTVVGVLPHVTRAPTEGFFHPDLFSRRPVRLGLIMKNRLQSVFFEVISKLTSNFQV